MTLPYLSQLGAIRIMLNSSIENEVEEAYDLLFELWQKYSDDNKFNNSVKELAEDHSDLVPEFMDRIDKLSGTNEKTNNSLKNNLKVLFLSEKMLQKTIDNKIPCEVAPVNDESQELDTTDEVQKDFSFSKSAIVGIATLISLAVLIGGLSAGYDIAEGMIVSLILVSISILMSLILILNILISKLK